MNKLAQGGGIFTLIFSLIFFLIVWFVWLGSWLNTVGQFMISNNSLTGIEAMICGNLNLVLVIVLFMAVMGYSYLRR